MKRFLTALLLMGMIFSLTTGYTQGRGDDVEKHRYENVTATGEEGLLRVCQDGKYGIIDTKGQVILPCEWDKIGAFSEGLAGVQKDGKYGFINAKGKLVISCEWDAADAFSEGFARVHKNEKHGLINAKGKVIIPCEQDEIVYGNGYFAAIKDQHLSIYNMKGKQVF